MRTNRKHIQQLGLFITIGFLLFVVGIYFIGRKQNLFTSNVKLITFFEDVSGLTPGNNVRFTGIDVGTVSSIKILSQNEVRVELSIQKSVIPFIKKNSIATIGTEGLMGNKTVIIIPGTEEVTPVKEGDILKSLKPVQMDDILVEIKKSSENIAIVSNNLIDITAKINRGEGMFGKIFTDTTITQNLDKASRNAVIISKNLNEISSKVNQGEGILGKMLTDTSISNNLDLTSESFAAISQNLSNITEKMNRGEGIFGRLFTDTTLTQNLYLASQNIKESSRNLQEISVNLKEITEKINAGNGLINKLLTDSAFADSIDVTVTLLNRGIVSATEASDAIKRSRIIRLFSKKEGEEESNEEEKSDKE